MKGRFLTPLWLLGTMVVLLGLMLVVQRYEPARAQDGIYNAKSLAATGFIILAAFSMGEFFQLMRMPALLGYIFAGILFGPNLAAILPGQPTALFGKRVISDLELINVVIVGVIGTLGGGELKIGELKSNLRTILAILVLNIAFVFPLTFLVVWHIPAWVPSIMPFAANLTSKDIFQFALFCGVFGAATSPTVTIAVLQENRARGPLTSLVLGTVVFADIALVGMVLIAVNFSKVLMVPEGVAGPGVLSALPSVAMEFGTGILIGVITGLVTIIYLRFVKREQLLFTVALIFTASYVCKLFHAETLLAFLTAGFLVQNFSSRGPEMISALERISLPVFVIYFMTQAAQLDPVAVQGTLYLTLVLTVLRTVSLVGATRLAGAITGVNEVMRRSLWSCLFSRGSVDLVLAGLVAASIPTWGRDFQMVIMSMVVIHIILGPPLLKRALDGSGETEHARAVHRAEAETIDPRYTADVESEAPELPVASFESDALNGRMTVIRDHLANLHRFVIVDPIEARAARLRAAFDHLEKSLAQALSSDEPTRAEYERDVQHGISVLERVSPLAIDEAAIDRLLHEVRGFEPFSRVYRIPGEAHLFEARPGDRGLTRFVKLLRRIRRFVRGKGIRTVPLGKLWRFYVELAIPISLSRAAESAALENEALWRALVDHVRAVEERFADPDPSLEKSEALAKSMAALRAKLESSRGIALDRFSRSLGVPFADFIAAAERAGTLELPAFQYRASARFDWARRAEQRLRTRIRQEHEIAAGLRGWIVLRHQVSLFVDWWKRYRGKLTELLARQVLDPCRRELDATQELCRRLLDGEELSKNGEKDWATGLSRWIKPAVARTVRRVEQILYAFGQAAAGRELHELLVVRIAALSVELRLPTDSPVTEAAHESKSTVAVPVREWFMSSLAREVGLRLVELRERVQDAMRSTLEALEEIEQVLEFNLLAAQRDDEDATARAELASGGLQRALRMIGEASDSLQRKLDEAGEWLLRETDALVEQTVQPLRDHRLEEIRRVAARRAAAALRERGESWASRQIPAAHRAGPLPVSTPLAHVARGARRPASPPRRRAASAAGRRGARAPAPRAAHARQEHPGRVSSHLRPGAPRDRGVLREPSRARSHPLGCDPPVGGGHAGVDPDPRRPRRREALARPARARTARPVGHRRDPNRLDPLRRGVVDGGGPGPPARREVQRSSLLLLRLARPSDPGQSGAKDHRDRERREAVLALRGGNEHLAALLEPDRDHQQPRAVDRLDGRSRGQLARDHARALRLLHAYVRGGGVPDLAGGRDDPPPPPGQRLSRLLRAHAAAPAALADQAREHLRPPAPAPPALLLAAHRGERRQPADGAPVLAGRRPHRRHRRQHDPSRPGRHRAGPGPGPVAPQAAAAGGVDPAQRAVAVPAGGDRARGGRAHPDRARTPGAPRLRRTVRHRRQLSAQAVRGGAGGAGAPEDEPAVNDQVSEPLIPLGPPLLEQVQLSAPDRGWSAVLLLLVAIGFLQLVRRTRRATGSPPHAWVRPAQLLAWAIVALTTVFLIGHLLPPAWRPAGLLILVAVLIGGLGFIKNVLAGVALLFERRLEIGDSISVDGLEGEIEAWGLRSVRMRAIDGTVHDIPNDRLLMRPVTNFTGSGADAACELEIAIPLGIDPFEAQETARIAAALSMYASPRRRPEVFLAHAIQEEMKLRVRGFAFDAVHRDHFESDVRVRITEALARTAAGRSSGSIVR